MDQRIEFVELAQQEGTNRRELCRRFEISAKTAYKWLSRAAGDSGDWAADRSRRPHESPARTAAPLEAAVLRVRDAHPAWGARKIESWLTREGVAAPAASTIHAILVRHGRVAPPLRSPAYIRFEYPAPNLVWQMDFKAVFRCAIDGGVIRSRSSTIIRATRSVSRLASTSRVQR